MHSIKIKILPGMGNSDGVWEIVSFGDFLTYNSPQLRIYVYVCDQFPPRHILNEELLSGGKDQGVSGGAFWKPFEISNQDYEELREELLTCPNINLSYAPDLEEKRTINNGAEQL